MSRARLNQRVCSTSPIRSLKRAAILLVCGECCDLVIFDLRKHLSCRPVNRQKRVASQGSVNHLRQVPDTHVHEARRVALKGLVNQCRGIRCGHSQVDRSIASKASARTRTRNSRDKKFARSPQKAIQGKEHLAARVPDDRLLG